MCSSCIIEKPCPCKKDTRKANREYRRQKRKKKYRKARFAHYNKKSCLNKATFFIIAKSILLLANHKKFGLL